MINLSTEEMLNLAKQKGLCAEIVRFNMGKSDTFEIFNEEMEKNDPVLCHKHINFI